jgi:hypothetical protein
MTTPASRECGTIAFFSALYLNTALRTLIVGEKQAVWEMTEKLPRSL